MFFVFTTSKPVPKISSMVFILKFYNFSQRRDELFWATWKTWWAVSRVSPCYRAKKDVFDERVHVVYYTTTFYGWSWHGAPCRQFYYTDVSEHWNNNIISRTRRYLFIMYAMVFHYIEIIWICFFYKRILVKVFIISVSETSFFIPDEVSCTGDLFIFFFFCIY